ncbi:ABC transporter permease [Chlamydiifrater volucris]|uniref:ABC transporter permease n=1 Tax=Chlamydiifrater volucris TaxID=2681470 RepID=UPI0032B13817
MKRYLKKRFLYNFLSLWIVISLTFLIMRTIPGDPFSNEEANALSPETLAMLKAHYGLDRPLIVQYFKYINSVLHFDFGHSLVYKDRTVFDIIKMGFPVSAILGLEGCALAIFGGIALGTLSAIKERFIGNWILYTSILQISLPGFVLATLLQYLFAVKFSLFPIACWGTFAHTILPSLSLSLTPMAFITKLTTTSVKEALSMDYVLLAFSKGIKKSSIILRHIIPYAIFPTISYASFLVTAVMTGTFAIENIFGIPGLGKWFIYSIKQRDYPVILGLAVFYAFFFMTASLLTDLIQAWIDPQLRRNYENNN